MYDTDITVALLTLYSERESAGGGCIQHGQGIEKFRPGHEMVVGTDGGLNKKYVKKKFWVCDLDLKGDKKLRQPALNFKMTQNDRKRGGDDGPN